MMKRVKLSVKKLKSIYVNLYPNVSELYVKVNLYPLLNCIYIYIYIYILYMIMNHDIISCIY